MNWIAHYFKFSPLVALILNFAGAVILLFCIGQYTGPGFVYATAGENGKIIEAAFILHPSLLKIGLVLLVVGFLIQAINELHILYIQP